MLGFVFTRAEPQPFDLHDFLGNLLLIIYIDEVPIGNGEVDLVCAVRDLLRNIRGILVILSGTHSKVANMIPITQRAATRTNCIESQLWALLFTRLPEFSLRLSGLMRVWTGLQRAVRSSPADNTSRDVISAIQSAMDSGGNPWLILWAISVAQTSFAQHFRGPSFFVWQTEFAKSVQFSKFSISGLE